MNFKTMFQIDTKSYLPVYKLIDTLRLEQSHTERVLFDLFAGSSGKINKAQSKKDSNIYNLLKSFDKNSDIVEFLKAVSLNHRKPKFN